MDVEFMCSECEPDAAVSRCSPGQQKLSFAACDQDLDYESDCDSMSSCGSSAESHHSLSFTAPSYSPHSGSEGMSEQATASSFVSLGLLQSSEGPQEGWLRELEAMGVPTTDDLEEALRSEGRLAYMPPKEERPAPAPSSLAPPPSPFGQSSDQVQPSPAPFIDRQILQMCRQILQMCTLLQQCHSCSAALLCFMQGLHGLRSLHVPVLQMRPDPAPCICTSALLFIAFQGTIKSPHEVLLCCALRTGVLNMTIFVHCCRESPALRLVCLVCCARPA